MAGFERKIMSLNNLIPVMVLILLVLTFRYPEPGARWYIYNGHHILSWWFLFRLIGAAIMLFVPLLLIGNFIKS